MHVSGGVPLDLNWFLQLAFTAFVIALALLHLVKSTASKYFEVHAGFESPGDCPVPGHRSAAMPGLLESGNACALCGNPGSRRCSACKAVRYCSPSCQKAHWGSGHSKKCRELAVKGPATLNNGKKRFVGDNGNIALVPARGHSNNYKLPKKILFPYDEFVQFFNWDKPGFPPCGLLNCGNSCFANVVLQCLAFTRPLVAYLLEKGHQRECKRNDWCFLCEFQRHVERASRSPHPFSPLSILYRLPNIGGNFGYGKQEDAHEFMRFAIDTMQSVCLDEFGGEKALHPSAQETSLIQHIFGGHLQSQVICSQCNKTSNQYENMMDLTVEIHGDAASLEECLNQFTAREWLHGENMYKCDGCNDYVKASKCLTVRRAPNVLTIALKRFQTGRFGKLNKRVSFPETLNLTPYMSEPGDGTDVYKLYAVVVHVDMLNASYFGHYICFIRDFRGNWYRIDDDKVSMVDLEEVLSQGAYMVLYSRISARPSSLITREPSEKEEQQTVEIVPQEPCAAPLVECVTAAESSCVINNSKLASPNSDHCLNLPSTEENNSESLDFVLGSEGTEACGDKNCEPEEMASHVDHALDDKVIRPDTEAESCGLTERPIPTQVLVLENGRKFHDASVPALSPAKEESAKVESLRLNNMLHSHAENLEKVEKMAGEESPTQVKLKPLFSPGFLAKRPRDKFTKEDGNDATECNGYRNLQINGEKKVGAEVNSDRSRLSSPTSIR